MPQIGPLEILVIAVIALIVFGPEKLPDMARTVGRGVNQLKSMASDVKSDFDAGLATDEAAPARSAPPVVSDERSPVVEAKPRVEEALVPAGKP